MKVLLIQLDGKFPNLALMRISTHHKKLGDEVELKHIGNLAAMLGVDFSGYSIIYASLIFEWNRPIAAQLLQIRPDAIVGGSGWDEISNDGQIVNIGARKLASRVSKVEDHGIFEMEKDYSLYPTFQHSIGFTQRGCRMACGFCKVPVIEGKIAEGEEIGQIWRGDPYPKNLILWDNDTFGAKDWKRTFKAILDGGFRVSFNQGVNARLMNDENAEMLAATPCYSDDFKVRRWYTAWDNKNDEEILFRGLRNLIRYGVKPDNIMVYMLIGYWPGETDQDRDYRRHKLRELGVRPYPMPFKRPQHQRGCKCDECNWRRNLVGFQRWIVFAYDKWVPWDEWKAADCRPEKLNVTERRPAIYKGELRDVQA